jgi:hypothetical protein
MSQSVKPNSSPFIGMPGISFGTLPIELIVYTPRRSNVSSSGITLLPSIFVRRKRRPDQPIALDHEPVGQAIRLELEAVLLHRLGEHLLAPRVHLLAPLLVGAVGHLHERHVRSLRR